MNSCAELVRQGDPERFLAVMAAPPAQREALFTVLAFNLEVARAPWVTNEEMIAEMRLQWWRDVLSEAETGAPPRAHEVAGPLHALIQTRQMPIARMEAMIAARRWDIYRDGFDDWAAFDAHITALSGGLFATCAASIGAPEADQALGEIAYASGVAGWLRAIPALEHAGRLPLPDGRPQAVADLAARARARLRGTGRTSAPSVARLGWLADGVLRRAQRTPARVSAGALEPSEAGKRLGLMWRSLRG